MRKIIYVLLLVIVTFIGCIEQDKTIVVDDNVLMEEIKNSKKIKSENIDIEVEEGFKFEPRFFYEDKIYGVLQSKDIDNEENYIVYYSKEEGLVKVREIEMWEVYSNSGEKNRRTLTSNIKNSGSTYLIKDSVTGEVKELPKVKIEFLSNPEKVRVTEDKDNSIGDGYYAEYIDRKYYGNEKAWKSDQYYSVVGSDNYFYRVVANFIYDENDEKLEFSYRNLYGKFDTSNFKSYSTAMVLYDYEEDKAITLEDNYSGKFPLITKVMYSKNNNKFYAFGGEKENEIYEIQIYGDKYSINHLYTIDLGERVTETWFSKVLGNSILLGTFITEEIDTSEIENKNNYSVDVIQKEKNTMLFDIESKKINVFNEDEEFNYISNTNSNKYLILKECNDEGIITKVLLGKVKDNKIEYVYEFKNYPWIVVFDDEEKRMLIQYFDDNGKVKHELFYLDIE
ncbi:hypothetical protein [Clostridium sp. D53t1_180928_C8]|uniref:hypothetical protein n=1 Tax=Clostridium sp. D53t1_180928_C8 TaxID=2787101 RepID=UPI0018ABFA60|nr:hypothetical protein [Clostridium sp. D53t1_180928_C8]